jgi:hypothetical protein
MSDRRFTEKPALDPGSIWELPPDHAAMRENRTLFPSTVVPVLATTPDRILISGFNNRKIGKTVEKGAFKGYGLYCLSLEERATCPLGCDMRAGCYGNAMQMARRHRIENPDIFFARLEEEIAGLLKTEKGLLIRLHVLGDFPSVEYVAFWLDILAQYPNVACYGYTHRLETALEGDEIGDAIASVKAQYPDRFRIRWSFGAALVDGAMVVENQDDIDGASQDEIQAIVCPAQTDATACCATCALCWATVDNCVLFWKHGKKSVDVALEKAARASDAATTEGESGAVRPVTPIQLPPSPKPAPVSADAPEIRMVYPTELRIEASYQRNLSGKSIRMIRKIATEWSWAKFKPPICAETPDGLFIIDGQHTAIGAASHPDPFKIPVLIVSADKVEDRARSFVSHNRERVNMSAFDVFHAEVAAGVGSAAQLASIAQEAGCAIPRGAVARNKFEPGQLIALNEARTVLGGAGEKTVARVLSICAKAKLTPITSVPLRAVRRMLENDAYAWSRDFSDDQIAAAMATIPDLDDAARTHAAKTGQDRQRACIMLIRDALLGKAAAE